MNNECNAFRPVENRPIPRQASRGLTLVELVVVLGIAGLLAAILIPSVQSGAKLVDGCSVLQICMKSDWRCSSMIRSTACSRRLSC